MEGDGLKEVFGTIVAVSDSRSLLGLITLMSSLQECL